MKYTVEEYYKILAAILNGKRIEKYNNILKYFGYNKFRFSSHVVKRLKEREIEPDVFLNDFFYLLDENIFRLCYEVKRGQVRILVNGIIFLFDCGVISNNIVLATAWEWDGYSWFDHSQKVWNVQGEKYRSNNMEVCI